MWTKVALAGGGAGMLAAGALIGGLTIGFIGAQTPDPRATPAQSSQEKPGEKTDGADNEAPVNVPAGSITADQAKQVAQAYVQQTAPYSTQGLQAGAVQVDDENGTVVYTVTLTGNGGASAEVTVSTQPPGQVVKAQSDKPEAPEQGGADTAD